MKHCWKSSFPAIPSLVILCLTISTELGIRNDAAEATPKKHGPLRVARENVCPDACRITEKNPHCQKISSLNVKTNAVAVSELCNSYLSSQFPTVIDCELRCMKCSGRVIMSRCSQSIRKVSKNYALCKTQPDTGLCKASFTMWYYDYESGECKEFAYGGCGGNRNKFDTELACLERCGLLGVLAPHPNFQKKSFPAHQEL